MTPRLTPLTATRRPTTRPLAVAAIATGLVVGLSGVTASGAVAAEPPAATNSTTFEYTGEPTTWTVPTGICSVTVFAAGAAGGDSNFDQDTQRGGLGGSVTAVAAVQPGDEITVSVGGVGATPGDSDSNVFGGYGGGGNGAAYLHGGNIASGGGGGATTVSLGATPIIIAGGGGGAGVSYTEAPATGGAGGQTGEAGLGSAAPEDGAGGASGANGGGGGIGGIGQSSDANGLDGGTATGQRGGDGASVAADHEDPHTGRGGGGGGGATGGGGGGGAAYDHTAAGGGGGGGSSSGPANAVFATGVQSGNGTVIVSYDDGSACAPVITPTTPAGSGTTVVSGSGQAALANTGANVLPLLGGLIAALGAGIALVVVVRRRSAH